MSCVENHPPDCLDLSIVTYQSARWLAGFFASLLAQEYPLDKIRLLVRDNGSTDETVRLVQDFINQHAQRFRLVRLDVGSNVGFGAGHNVNLALAESPYFLVSNVDLEFFPATITRLVASALADSDQVAAWECRQLPFEHPKYYHPATLETGWVSCACALFRTDAMRSVGGFEPCLFMYGEDVELSYRLRDKGYLLRYVPKAAVTHYAYSTPHEVKPSQIIGNHLANALLRVRYGSTLQRLAAPFLMLARLLFPRRFPGQRVALLANVVNFTRLAEYFWKTRKKSETEFEFSGWNYGIRRSGAFYPIEALNAPWPLVSILVRTVKGRAGKLAEAVSSVINQTYPNLELIVVEDGSDSARDYIASIALSNPTVQIVFEPLPKVGRCQAGNRALALARGEYLCFLDDDDLLFADHVEVLACALRKNSQYVAVFSSAMEVRTATLSNEPWHYRELGYQVSLAQPFSRRSLVQRNCFSIQSVLFRRTLFEKCGGFDTELDSFEDWNLWLRYSLAGDFGEIEKTTSIFRVPAFSGDASRRRRQMIRDYYSQVQKKNAEAILGMGVEFKDLKDNSKGRTLNVLLRDFSARLPLLDGMYYPLRDFFCFVRRCLKR